MTNDLSSQLVMAYLCDNMLGYTSPTVRGLTDAQPGWVDAIHSDRQNAPDCTWRRATNLDPLRCGSNIFRDRHTMKFDHQNRRKSTGLLLKSFDSLFTKFLSTHRPQVGSSACRLRNDLVQLDAFFAFTVRHDVKA